MAEILIIDDEQTEHLLLSRVIRKVDPSIGIKTFTYAEDALRYLKTPNRSIPSLILVDINMPRMNGFDFVEAYTGLYAELRGAAQVWVMSNSIDPRDRLAAEASPAIEGYVEKSAPTEIFRGIVRAACRAGARDLARPAAPAAPTASPG